MTTRNDPHEGMRGKWDVSGFWWCDCPGKNNDSKSLCKRCDIRRPLKGSTVYALRSDGLQGGGFMRYVRLVPVKSPDGMP